MYASITSVVDVSTILDTPWGAKWKSATPAYSYVAFNLSLANSELFSQSPVEFDTPPSIIFISCSSSTASL